jgi:hypothetical protein
MAKTVEILLKNGSLIETVSTQSFLTANSPKFYNRSKGKAMSFDGVNQRAYAPNATIGDITTGDFSIEMYIKFNDITSIKDFATKMTASAGWGMYVGGGNVVSYIRDATGNAIGGNNSVSVGLWYHLIATYDRDGNSTIYKNAVAGTGAVISTKQLTLTNTATMTLGSYPTPSDYCNCEIALVRQFNTVLTQQEINKLYDEFLHSSVMAKAKTGFVNPVITDLSRYKGTGINQGLVAAYNMRPTGSTLVDISGNGKNGTISGAISSLNGIVSDGNISSIATGVILNDATTWSLQTTFSNYDNTGSQYFIGGQGQRCFVLKYGETYIAWRTDDVGDFIPWDGSGNSIAVTQAELKNKTITFQAYSNGTNIYLYINGVSKGYITPSSISRTTKIYISNLLNGYPGTGTAVNMNLMDVRIYNRVLSAQEIKDYHNSFISNTLVEDFSDAGADGVAQLPREWDAGTGSYKVLEATADDSVLKTIKKGTKYLQNITAGTIAIPSKTAYGTWEFDWYKGADGNDLVCGFLADRIGGGNNFQGYFINPTSTEIFGLYKNNIGSNNGLFYSAASYITINTWYRVKITRTPAGVFTVLIKGGAFTATAGYDGWTLVSVTGGSGTNPVTDTTYSSSNFFMVDLDASDRITNIIIRDGIKQ